MAEQQGVQRHHGANKQTEQQEEENYSNTHALHPSLNLD